MTGRFDDLVGSLELKEMDGVLLSSDIRWRAGLAGIPIGRLDDAIRLAAWAHRGQRRLARGDLPRTAYIEHPLRNAARVLRWGVDREPVVLACLLHDTVEDHAPQLAGAFGSPAIAEHAARDVVLSAYAGRFGERTAHLVRAMSNPISDGTATDEAANHENYRRHVIAEIADPEVAICKLADLADNALSLHHTADVSPRTARLARKYAPLLPVFRDRIAEDDIRALVDAHAVETLTQALSDGAERLRVLSGSA